MTTQHTPKLQAVEYKACPSASREMHVIGTVTDQVGYYEVGYVYNKEMRDHIVRCVNAHDALVDALQSLLNVEHAAQIGAANKAMDGLDVLYHFEKARAALKAATGE